MKKVLSTVIFIGGTFLFGLKAMGDVNYFDLSLHLMASGNEKKALETLKDAKITNNIERSKYHLVYGKHYLRLGKLKEAKSSLLLAKDYNPVSPEVLFSLIQLYLKEKKYTKIISELKRSPELKERKAYYIALSEAYLKNKKISESWKVLTLGLEKFKGDKQLQQQKWLMLLDSGLVFESFSFLKKRIKFFSVGELEKFIYEYVNRKEYKHAMNLSRVALVEKANNSKLIKLITLIYVKQKKYFLATNFVESHIFPGQDDEIINLGIKLNQRLKRYKKADYLSFNLKSNDFKVQSQIAEFLAIEDYEKLILLERSVLNSKLAENDDVLYAMAYGHFVTGSLKKALNRLNLIKGSKSADKTAALRETIIGCLGDWGKCIY